MAQVSNQYKDDDTQFTQQQQGQGGASTGSNTDTQVASGSGQTGSASGSAAAPQSAYASTAQQSKGQQAYADQGSFHNISALLNANQGQGQRVTDHAVSTADSIASSANSAYGKAQSQYQGDVASGTPTFYNYTPQQTQSVTHFGGSGGIQSGVGHPGASLYAATGAPATATPPPPDPSTLPQADEPALAAAQAATYTGPSSMATDTKVDNAGLQSLFQNLGEHGRALGSNDETGAWLGETGGIGALDSLLAHTQDAPELSQQSQHFNDLAQRLNAGTTNTSLADAARAATSQSNSNANQTAVDRTNAVNKAMAAQSAYQDQQRQDDAANNDLLQKYLKDSGGFNGIFNTVRQGFGGAPTFSQAQYRQIYDYAKKTGMFDKYIHGQDENWLNAPDGLKNLWEMGSPALGNSNNWEQD